MASAASGTAWALRTMAGLIPALALAAGSHAQPSIGRLFSTPEQRAELDRIRHDAEVAGEETPDTLNPPLEMQHGSEIAPRARTVTIDGILLRSDGHGVAWVNGVEVVAGTTTPGGVRVGAVHARRRHVRIRMPGSQVGTELEPGQTIDVVSGRVLDAYEPRPAASRDAASPVGPVGSDLRAEPEVTTATGDRSAPMGSAATLPRRGGDRGLPRADSADDRSDKPPHADGGLDVSRSRTNAGAGSVRGRAPG